MNRGKVICEILKVVRGRVAMLNGVDYEPVECLFDGDCSGVCPKCDAELKALELHLENKRICGCDVVYGANDRVFTEQLYRMASECADDDSDGIETLSGIMPLLGDIGEEGYVK